MVKDSIKGCKFSFVGTIETIWWYSAHDKRWLGDKPTPEIAKWKGPDYYCGSHGNRWLCTQCAEKFGIKW